MSSSVMLEIYRMEKSRWRWEVCMCVRAGIYACVCSYAPTTHIRINDFISSHVGNEQPEFLVISCEAGGFFVCVCVLEMNQHSSPLVILSLLLLLLHKKR